MSQELSAKHWKLCDDLARELAQRGVSQNMVREAMTYSVRFRGSAALRDWLKRLSDLEPELFASGKVTFKQRQDLANALVPRLQRYPSLNWPLILGWAARLMLYYEPQKAKAERGSWRNR